MPLLNRIMDEQITMTGTKPQTPRKQIQPPRLTPAVVVACPDARPPAYELVKGLASAGELNAFITGYYHKPAPWHDCVAKIGNKGGSLVGQLQRRRIDGVMPEKVSPSAAYDFSIRLENKVAAKLPVLRSRLARRRTEQFDRIVASRLPRFVAGGANVALFFSDVGSGLAMAEARKQGLKVVLSMVTGHMDEETEILAREKTRVPEFFPVYLGDGSLDMDELAWLHNRRRRDLAQADLVLVPSKHIARQVVERSGVPENRVRVIPYAADPDRFRPVEKPENQNATECRFLFAGGITQRKGLSDLLAAWRQARRPGWSLSLVGEAPRSALGLIPADDPSLRVLGRVAYGEMPALMASHDIFVFPSLFEGSAVVCYEALAAGLPVITTPQAGSVVRDSQEGLIVPAASPKPLSAAMVRLGTDVSLRSQIAVNARLRALDHTWDHYRRRVLAACAEALEMPARQVGQGGAGR